LQDFAEAVRNEVVRLSGRVILEAALGTERDPADGQDLLDAVCSAKDEIGLARVNIVPTVPVVAVGAPVRVYYGEVGRRLHADIRFPEYCEVANAVGAATGVIARSISVHISGDGGGVFRLHGPSGTEVASSGTSALARAEVLASNAARQAAIAMGADEPEIRLAREIHLLPDAVDENGMLSATLTAEAIGRPKLE
jgi:hypothetical protein